VRTVREVFTRPGVDYRRVPISDERAPELKDFQALYDLLHKRSTPRLFNCHAGRGRTTTAMVIADLVEQGPAAQPQSVKERRNAVQESLWEAVAAFQERTDAAIRLSGRLQDLKAAIWSQEPAPQGHNPSPEAALAARARDYLRRYFLLQAFAEFVSRPDPAGFAAWLELRPEKTRALERLERWLGLTPEA
jgi:hypothetical protein